MREYIIKDENVSEVLKWFDDNIGGEYEVERQSPDQRITNPQKTVEFCVFDIMPDADKFFRNYLTKNDFWGE